jgi:CRISPR-associated endonuclease/helicase Cas3
LSVLIPLKNGTIYPAPYGEYDRKNKFWIPCDAFEKTLKIIEKNSYNAEKLVNLLNKVYSSQNSFSPKAKDNAKSLKEYFSWNWLINSKQITAADATEANFWKSRNIGAQSIVFTQKPQSEISYNYFAYQTWKIKYSIELPVYLIEKGIKLHMIDKFKIQYRDEDEIILVIREGFYSYDKGVSFNELEDTCL